METQYRLSHIPQTKGQAQVPMLQKSGTNHLPFLAVRSASITPRPPSEATEIADTDIDVEEEDISERQSSSRKSGESFGNDSSTTLSTPDELHTPGPFESGPIDLQWDDKKPVQGPNGPHLFRTSVSSSSTGKIDEEEWYFPTSPPRRSVTQEKPAQRQPSDDVRSSSRSSSVMKFPRQDEEVVRSWTPTQVAEWMYEYNVEDAVVECFISNDISGTVLLDLQIDDLKELDIRSFGKRHRLMTMIQGLRDSLTPSSETPKSPRASGPSGNTNRNHRSKSIDDTMSPLSPACDPMSPTSPSGTRSRRNRSANQDRDIISPAESASIVAIEQLLPKPHKCSKGENCPKYRRRQRKIAQIAEEFPNEPFQVTGNRIRTTLTDKSAATESVHRPKSDQQPSVVASSDVLGPAEQPEFKLNAENLNEVQPRDPQENVRQFLTLQHMDCPPGPQEREREYDDSNSQPRLEMFPPLNPPDSSSPTEHMAANLRGLPKLTIPQNDPAEVLSSQRTITPSRGSKQMGSATATQEYNPYHYAQFPTYRQGTPFSEMDVPITAIPDEPLARETSQSVPPHWTYGRTYQAPFQPTNRAQSRAESRRQPSFVNNMARVEEGKMLNPINDPSDMVARRGPAPSRPSDQLDSSSGSISPVRDPDVAHSGYMKKRRTRLLRHEWQDAHFTLKGTVLAMHKDENDALRNSRALESIDVDDYAVACSSLASSSKLTAAFRRSLMKRAATLSSKGLDETAFAFSLVPSSEKQERKIFNPTGKSHHFAVKSRDERIDWMRELMLAKALKKGKEGGEEVQVNGSVI